MPNGPLESVIVKAAVTKLNELPNCVAEKLHGGPMSGHQKLDVLCCRDGQMYYLEGKRPGEVPTARQESTMRKWRKAGAICEVFTSAAQAVDIVTRSRQKGDAALLD